VLVLAAGQLALGGAINLKEVASDAKWLAHYDGEAARSSKVMRAVQKEWMGKDVPDQAHESSHLRPWACTSLKKLDGVTLYGSRVGLHNGVAIVRGKFDRDALIGKLKDSAGAKASSEGGTDIYTWTKGKGTKWEHLVALAFPRDGVLVFAASPREVLAAIDLINGKGENLASKSSPLTADLPKKAILLARAAGLKPDDVSPKFKLLGLVSGFEYFAEEREDRWHESVRVRAHKEPAARALQDVLAGMRGMAELLFDGHEEVVQALTEAKVKRNEKEVSVAFDIDADELAKQVPTLVEELRDQWLLRMTAYRHTLGDRELHPGSSR